MTGGRGTPGYVAPEICDRDAGPVTDKSDVYSFGMLLLEIVGGRKNFDWNASRSSQFYFPEWAFKLLKRGKLGMILRGGEIETEDEKVVGLMTKVGLWCIQYNSRDRPCMGSVVQMLEGNGDDVAIPSFAFNMSSAASPEIPMLSQTEEFSSIDMWVRLGYSILSSHCCEWILNTRRDILSLGIGLLSLNSPTVVTSPATFP